MKDLFKGAAVLAAFYGCEAWVLTKKKNACDYEHQKLNVYDSLENNTHT
jgi:hypothetical protein